MVSNGSFWLFTLFTATVLSLITVSIYPQYGLVGFIIPWIFVFFGCVLVGACIFPYECPKCNHHLGGSCCKSSELIGSEKSKKHYTKCTHTGTSCTEYSDGETSETKHYSDVAYVDIITKQKHLKTITCNNCRNTYTKTEETESVDTYRT